MTRIDAGAHPVFPCPCSQAAEKLKRRISKEVGVPLLPPLPKKSTPQQGGDAAAGAAAGGDAPAGEAGAAASADAAELHPYNVRKSALAYQRHRQQMPEDKRR